MAPDDHGDGGLGWVGGEVSPHPLLYTTGPWRRRTSDNTGQVVQRPSGSSRTCGVQARLPASWAGFGQCDPVFPIDGAINGSGRVSSASVGTTAPRYVATGGLAHTVPGPPRRRRSFFASSRNSFPVSFFFLEIVSPWDEPHAPTRWHQEECCTRLAERVRFYRHVRIFDSAMGYRGSSQQDHPC